MAQTYIQVRYCLYTYCEIINSTHVLIQMNEVLWFILSFNTYFWHYMLHEIRWMTGCAVGFPLGHAIHCTELVELLVLMQNCAVEFHQKGTNLLYKMLMSTNFGKWECVTQAPSCWMHDGYQCFILVTQKWDITLYIDGSIELTPQSSEAHFQSWSSTSKSPLPPKIPWTGPEVCCSSWGFHQSLRGEQQETRQLWEPAFATSTAERRDCKRGKVAITLATCNIL